MLNIQLDLISQLLHNEWNKKIPMLISKSNGEHAIQSVALKYIWAYYTYLYKSFRMYRQISIVRRTKFENLNVSRLDLQLSLSNTLKPGVESIMKM